jgi:hypothetical protein
MLPPQIQEIGIVPFLKEYVSAVVAAIVNMIKSPIGERRDISWHS